MEKEEFKGFIGRFYEQFGRDAKNLPRGVDLRLRNGAYNTMGQYFKKCCAPKSGCDSGTDCKQPDLLPDCTYFVRRGEKAVSLNEGAAILAKERNASDCASLEAMLAKQLAEHREARKEDLAELQRSFGITPAYAR